jgi:hypothetical protein
MPFPINSHVIRRTTFNEKDKNPKWAIIKVTSLNANFLNNSTEYELRPVKPLDLIEMDSLDPGKTIQAIVISVQRETAKTIQAIVISVQRETATILIDRMGTTAIISIHNVTIIGYCDMQKFQNN